MTLAELRKLYRETTGDLEKPYKWLDSEIDEYATDAELEACRRAHLLVDSTSDAARASVVASDSSVVLDERVIFVRRARLSSRQVPLRIIPAAILDEQFPGWENAQPSTPLMLVPDLDTYGVTLYPPPKTDDVLYLTVVREPLLPLTKPSDSPEIPRRYHRSLLNWMLFRGYSKIDTETLDKGRAVAAQQLFEQEFGAKSRAIDEHWAREQYYEAGDFQ